MGVHEAVIIISGLLLELHSPEVLNAVVKSSLDILLLGISYGLLTYDEYLKLTTEPGSRV